MIYHFQVHFFKEFRGVMCLNTAFIVNSLSYLNERRTRLRLPDACHHLILKMSSVEGFLDGSVVKKLSASAGNVSLIPGWEQPPGERNGNPGQYSCLENPMDRGTWRALHGGRAHGVAKSWTRLSTVAHTY